MPVGMLEVLRTMERDRRRETRFAAANEWLRIRLRELAERPLWLWAAAYLVKREVWVSNRKRVYRTYVEEKLVVFKRGDRVCTWAGFLLTPPNRPTRPGRRTFFRMSWLRFARCGVVDRGFLHAGDAGYRGRYLIVGTERGPRAGKVADRTRVAAADCDRSRYGFHFQGARPMGIREQSEAAFHHTQGTSWRTAMWRASTDDIKSDD
jgi:hypothetical protein